MEYSMGLSKNISEYMLNVFGQEYLDNYQKYIDKMFTVYIRISPLYGNKENIIKNLLEYGIELEQSNMIPNAYKVNSGFDNLGKTIDFTLGRYYIQSLSSMIPPLILDPSNNDVVLDLCAAPGSKSTQLAELMNNQGTLYANEPNLNRVKSLSFNFDKMSLVNTGTIKHKGELLSKVFENYFDKILVDAPCSGLGILQKRGEVGNWWELNIAEKIAELQFRLIVSAIKMLKVGGEMVYSTCTLTVEENEINLNKILRKYPVEIQEIKLPVTSHPAITEIHGEKLNPEIAKAHRIIPWEVQSEGFFVVKLKKMEEAVPARMESVKKRDFEFFSAHKKNIKPYLQQLSDYYGIDFKVFENFQYYFKGNDIFFISANFKVESQGIFQRIGRKFGLIDRRDYCHFHSLAIQIFGDHITKNIIELTEYSDLKVYLNGQTLRKQFQPFGQKIIKFQTNLIGTAIAFNDGLKSQFPRSLRTSEIIIPEVGIIKDTSAKN